MYKWCILVGHETRLPKSKLKRIVARNAAKKHLFAPLSSPHISSSSFSFMLLFLVLFNPAVFIYFSSLFHFLSFTQHPSSWHTSRRASHLFSLKCFCIQGRAIHRGVAVSPAFGVVRLWLSPKALFKKFLGHHQFCATALSRPLSPLQSVFAGTCKPPRLLSGRSCCSVCALVYASVVWRESLKGPPL